ncbi:MAG: 3-hydroxyacyl-CoA dehydrogenase family protein [Acidobacteria bacterium]|nr:3-hydroxyacyl-CoA dehydrogenase family protein [Acidobacteriota bacterium]
MGSGITYTVALKIPAKITVVEQNDQLLGQARSRICRFVETGIKRSVLTEPEATELLQRIHYSADIGSLAASEMVVEAVFEDLAVKQKVFERLENVCSPNAVLASNTSGISITQIASVTRDPKRVVGTHFFNPVPVMKLVEVVRGEKTSDETVATARSFCEQLGKEVVVSADRPGFITTRVGQAYMCEALRCLEEGVGTAEDIDKGVRLAYNFPMGPFQLLDLIGLDTELHIMESLSQELGKRFDPGPIMRKLVAGNRLGRKTGRGFFEYETVNKT